MTAVIETALAEAQALLENKIIDPLGADGKLVKTGDVLTIEQYALLAEKDTGGGYGTGRSCRQQCAGIPGVGYGYCQREKHGPELPHLVVTRDRVVAWAWQNGEVPVEPTPDEVEDPADAKVEVFTQGLRVNYRNKRDKLFVLSVPRKRDEVVEIVDLTHQRMRKIKKELLVPARDDDAAPTQDEMRWMGTFIAARRKSALDIALRERENGRWQRDQMNASLAKIDIAPRVPRYGTSFSATLDIKLPPGMVTLNAHEAEIKLRAVLAEAVKNLGEGYEVRRIREVYGGTVEELR